MKIFKSLFVVGLLTASYAAHADFPYMSNNTADERTRVQNGEITCEVSKPHATLNVGAYGSKENTNYYGQDNDKGGYVSISIPLGSSNSDVDCNRLYDLSVKEKELKIKMLEEQVKTLQARTLNVEE